MKKEKIKTIAYWVTTIFGPASFVIGGFLFATHGEQQVAEMNHLGYPLYFITILGIWKFLGAIVTVISRPSRSFFQNI
ncbi:DoxX-like family protein [Paenibacillus sp. yr247]|uniref:DoxX family protein n=1 Tax=Paenibacillus sp. yr247 TaxID=1761880 RepID=UPI0008904C5E|nr:DoxX family protein [Paenibacillus sp. yr247]SDM82413.1 DoxX-like family protein [Paenibacillus sp. yr247]